MLKTRVLPFEYEILKRLKGLEIDWSKQRLLMAYSGGRDSVALLSLLQAIQSRLNFEIIVAHVHHGRSKQNDISKYRTRASQFAKKACKAAGVEFHLLKNAGDELKSEAEFRKLRERLLEEARIKLNCDFIVFAHHSDDLLETRLIRMIRGTGAQGLLSMNLKHGFKLRPLLSTSANQIAEYLSQKKLKWIDDPTNADDQYFRNWIRNSWLPLLEQKRPGSGQALSRSLEQLSETVSAQSTRASSKASTESSTAIKRKEFASLTLIEKREVLARVMLERGARDFSRRQIDEILKRLSSHRGVNRRKMSFEVGGLEWRVNAEQIEAVRL